MRDTVNNLQADELVSEAARRLSRGEICAIPTETVYGLAADASNGEAVARIFETKGRPQFNPLICHVASMEMAEEIAVFDDVALRLAETFWPGPLTLILPLKPGHDIHPLVTAGLPTVGVRMPKGLAHDVITMLGKPLAAPSANRSGGISPTSADAVRASLGARVPFVLDGGPCPVGLESTIVAPGDGCVLLLRPGGISANAIEAVTGLAVRRRKETDDITAPGQLASHYAPDATMRLNVTEVEIGEALLAFGAKRADHHERALHHRNLSPSGDLVEAAANLFAMMMELDATGARRIAVEPIPSEGLGEAINDRLRRAAAPRDNQHG